MSFYQQFIEKHGLCKRSMPNVKNWKEYVAFTIIPFTYWLTLDLSKEPETWLFFNLLSTAVFASSHHVRLYVLLIVLVNVHIYKNFKKTVDLDVQKDILELIGLIQYNHLVSIKEKLDYYPELASGLYENKSLLFWAHYYKNKDAHRLIIEALKNQGKVISKIEMAAT